MNLLVITSGYPQLGTNRYINPFVKGFTDLVKDRFENIYVISPQPFLPKILEGINYFNDVSRGTNFYNYSYDNIKVFYPTWYYIPFITRKINWKLALNKIYKTIKKNNLDFDIIHCHFLGNGLWARELKKMYKDKKVILHCHEFDTLKKRLKNEPEKESTILSSVDYIISFNKQREILNNFLKNHNIKTPNIFIPNFINTEKFTIEKDKNKLRKNLGFKTSDKILIHIGNLYRYKGQMSILNIRQNLEKEIKDIHLILIGDGPDKQKIKLKINSLKTSNIHFLGEKIMMKFQNI